jgi:hypothetical protein
MATQQYFASITLFSKPFSITASAQAEEEQSNKGIQYHIFKNCSPLSKVKITKIRLTVNLQS